jgi:hypothetical protein
MMLRTWFERFRTTTATIAMMLASPCIAQVLPPPPERPNIDENGIDVITGLVGITSRDLSIGGDGPSGLQYVRYLNGSDWRSNFDTLKDVANPTEWNAFFNGTVSYANSSERFENGGPLLETGSQLSETEYSKIDGTRVSFGHVVHSTLDQHLSVADYVEYADGTRWTYHYKDAPGYPIPIWRIQSVTSNRGYQIKLVYATDAMAPDFSNRELWGQVTQAIAVNNAHEYCDPLADSCFFYLNWQNATYSRSATQNTVTDALGNSTRYTNGTTLSIKTPDSAVDNIFYYRSLISKPCLPNAGCILGFPYSVTSVDNRGKVTSYSYTSPSSGVWQVTSTEPSSIQKKYESGFADSIFPFRAVGPFVLKYTDPNFNIHNYTYNNNQSFDGVILPEGNSVKLTLDSAGRVTQTRHCAKAGCGSGMITESQNFAGTGRNSTLPGSRTDPNGNVTTYTYSPLHGGVLTETLPAVSGVSPVKRYAYAQQYSWLKSPGGGYAQAATPVWVLTEERTCRTTATIGDACAGGGLDEVLVSYEYEVGNSFTPSNLLLKGKVVTANGISLRTCYGYDIKGNRISETSPSGGLSACS